MALTLFLRKDNLMTKNDKDRKAKKRKKHKDDDRGGDEPSSSKTKMSRKEYEAKLQKLQVELVRLQAWVKHSGARIVVIFEGRDAAGKGGVIKRIAERVSPRVFRVVALPAPNDRERSQLYMQRYIAHLPAEGEVVLFDRSWYNRLGVERVMGFCTDEEYDRFRRNVSEYEHALVEDGVILVKYWLSVGSEEQEQRFRKRIEDPMRQWKLSPMDTEARRRWYDYSRARDAMLEASDTDYAPWYIVHSTDKKRARLNCISHLLSLIPYEDVPRDEVKLPDRDESDAYDDVESLAARRTVPERY
jgi:polyphosphate kinase 2